MRRAVKSGIALMSMCALVAAPGCSRTPEPALPTLPAQAQNPGPRISLGPTERAGADATKHIVVVFMQNNSFNKLFGTWDQVNGDPVDNIAKAERQHTVQVGQDGKPLDCLLMNDVNLQPGGPAGPPECAGTVGDTSFKSAFPDAPFALNGILPPDAVTCPPAGTDASLARFAQVPADNGVEANSPGAQAGGCTRDLVHRFYQEQYQLNGGAMNRYAAGSDAAGLVMGYYDTKQLKTYQYLTGPGAPKFAVADKFFAGSFGGSFANGQWLISSTLPQWPDAPDSVRSVLDENGMPKSSEPAGPKVPFGQYNYYQSRTPDGLKDGQMTQACGTPRSNPKALCGDWVVNTSFPVQWPYPPGAIKERLVPLLKHATIGDRLNDAGIDWAWYSGGWSNADGLTGQPGWTNGTAAVARDYTDNKGEPAHNPAGCPAPTSDPTTTWPLCPDMDFQYHHQSFNYFYNWSQETEQTRANRARNRQDCGLKPVSFVQEIGPQNQHPGYGSTYVGDEAITGMLKSIYEGPCASDTLTIVTYDEFGGAWDHVAPPGQGSATKGAHDEFGPGTRLPTLFISNNLPRSGVDSTTYDLSSVIGTITAKFGLDPVNRRDSEQATVWSAWSALRRG
jgi:phospholipase C